MTHCCTGRDNSTVEDVEGPILSARAIVCKHHDTDSRRGKWDAQQSLSGPYQSCREGKRSLWHPALRHLASMGLPGGNEIKELAGSRPNPNMSAPIPAVFRPA